MLTPASRQMSTRRVASGTPEFPQARKNSFEPPNVPVPRLRTGTFNPERPRILNSIFGGSLGYRPVRWPDASQSFVEILASCRILTDARPTPGRRDLGLWGSCR